MNFCRTLFVVRGRRPSNRWPRVLVVVIAALVVPSLLAVAVSAEETAFSPDKLEYFEKQVRPILVNRCYECHSGETAEPKGALRVDSREFLLAGGDTRAAIVPGSAKESLLIDAISYGETYQMPPKSRMPESEIAVLTKWINDGAAWPAGEKLTTNASAKAFDLAARKAAHWSWRALTNPPLPQVKNTAWPRVDLDRFILAKLEANNFTPAAPAERRALIRRIYFDLIGLPPTPAQVAPFLADDSSQAVSRLVDELLKSPEFGERWARHWLDLARYAESRGHEFDPTSPNAYQYRDYVIRAFNADVPYNQFVVEQMAGDLLPEPRLHQPENNSEAPFNESILGTGFWFLGEWVHSPVDIRKDEVDRYDNMVDVFSKSLLGLTVSCARCHDHKFDAISQKDYYALFGYLQSSSFRLVRFDTMLDEERIARELAALNARFEPELKTAIAAGQQESAKNIADYLLAAREAMQKSLPPDATASLAADKKLDANRLNKWIAALQVAAKQADDPLYLWARCCETKAGDDDLQQFAGLAQPLHANYQQQQAEFEKQVALSQIVVDYRHLGEHQWMQNGVSFGLAPVPTGSLLFAADGADSPIAGFADITAARRDPTWNGLKMAAGSERDSVRLGNFDRAGKTLRTPTFTIESGLVHYLVRGNGHAYVAVDSHSIVAGPLHGQTVIDFDKGESRLRWITQDLRAYPGHRAHVEFCPAGESPLEIVMVVQATQAPPVPTLNLDTPIAVAAATDTAATVATRALQQQECLAKLSNWLWAHRELVSLDETKTADIFAKYKAERKQLTEQIKPESRYAMAMWDGTGEDESLMIRGSHKNMGSSVPRRLLEAIAGDKPMAIEQGSGRLELARQLVDPAATPYVPRVMANRVWHQLFGRGIVPSVDNFGVLGQSPTHPELLDHLASRLVERGWSVKQLIREIMLSRTYQMASTMSDAGTEERDPKNLLWRRTNIRRLQAETIRDSLLAISGRLDSTMYGPSVPVHLTAFMQGRGRPGADGPVDGAGRRSIYLSVRRNFLSPMMLAFDTPIPFSTMGARNVSNVPAQALILMNDPLVLQQAELWAKHVLAEPNRPIAQRIDAMYQTAFARPASDDEIATATAFLHSQAAEYGLPATAAESDVRVWADLAHVLFNAKEFIFLD